MIQTESWEVWSPSLLDIQQTSITPSKTSREAIRSFSPCQTFPQSTPQMAFLACPPSRSSKQTSSNPDPFWRRRQLHIHKTHVTSLLLSNNNLRHARLFPDNRLKRTDGSISSQDSNPDHRTNGRSSYPLCCVLGIFDWWLECFGTIEILPWSCGEYHCAWSYFLASSLCSCAARTGWWRYCESHEAAV